MVEPINLLIYVIVIIILVIVIFWLLNHFMFIAPLGFEQQIMYHDNGGGVTRSL
jgi:hypothetical protein